MISTIIFSALIVLGSAHCPAFTTLRAAGGGFGASYFKYCLQSKFLGNPRVFYRPIPDQQALRALNQKVSFSASYIPTRPSAVLNIPLLGGAVAIAHSNPRCRCNLTKEQLCGIFMGKITEWDEIGCNCEDNKITVIVRQDDSGDIDIVTGSLLAYCGIDVDENAPVWPPGVITVNGNEGVIDALNENPCAIAYIGYGAVEQADLKTCAIQNRSGKFVGPNKRSVEMGIAGASVCIQHQFLQSNSIANESSFPTKLTIQNDGHVC